MASLFQIYCLVWRWQNVENRSASGEAI